MLGFMVAVAGCAAAGTGSANGSVITRDQIAAANQMTALEVVRTERPHWLRHRGSTSFSSETPIKVYIDGVPAGGPEMLSEVATINIEEIRYYSPREAQFKFGTGHVQGAIEVVTLRR